MLKSKAVILINNPEARRMVASGGRISTTQGTALEVFERSGDAEKDLKLIKKVLSSGHASVLEHHDFCVAFDDVSVLVEQFMIEHRLASYTVKSRRYVDYTNAGYFIPKGLTDELRSRYVSAMDSLFAFYSKAVEAGIPKEDARFVLPYAFRSNFYMTLNGREMTRLISEMTEGRGSVFPEIKMLGEQLKAQFAGIYPNLTVGGDKACAVKPFKLDENAVPAAKSAGSELLYLTHDTADALVSALRFSGRFPASGEEELDPKTMLALVRDGRPRELEYINARFLIKNVSLACVTHFARHRMLSLMVPDVREALNSGGYVLPQSVAGSELKDEYTDLFVNWRGTVDELLSSGYPVEDLGYLALAGMQVDLLLGMDGRELLHFIKLRTCARAQWEIRAVAKQMLRQLNDACEDIFWVYGPSCKVDGRCPEGKLSCGKPQT